jgi:predicted nucleic acid-binding protein
VAIIQPHTVREACRLAIRYGFSFYDSFIVAAALENGCTTLYFEDLNANQLVEGTLRIVNPF